MGISWITEEEAALIPNRTEPLPGNEGRYAISLDVFHQLHCLVRLHLERHGQLLTSLSELCS